MGTTATTTNALRYWEKGQPDSERLAAQILVLEGYDSVDPQHPLGGRDGKKDILCEKDKTRYVVAVSFNSNPVDFRTIRSKFVDDYSGVSGNGVDGIVFVTNAKLTASERNTLKEIAEKDAKRAEIYHVERIRVILDNPRGYGLRLQYLGIKMDTEEYLAFFELFGIGVLSKLDEIDKRTVEIQEVLDKQVAAIVNRLDSKLEEKFNELRKFYDSSITAEGSDLADNRGGGGRDE